MPIIHVNEAALYYEEHGTGSETIVFAHGLLWSCRMFDTQVALLKDRYRCVAFDFRGQGQSEVTQGGYGMEALYEDAVALIEQLGCAPCHFLGLSIGGFIGLRLAARHPEFLRSLILMETSADPEPSENAAKYRQLTFVARWFGLGLLVDRVMPVMFGRTFLTGPARAGERHEWRHRMSDEQVMAECATLFGAGHETTATALSWTWYLLCQHPESYQKVQQEVDSVLQGRTPTYKDLACLPYCLQVFKEAMRLYPPAYAFSRRALCEVEIDSYRVPKGRVVLLAPYTLHRREEYFPDPEKFDPERFAPEREKQLPRYAYLPFGAGPRICIGMYFAMLEGHLLLVTLAQRVSFSLVPGQAIEPDPVHHLALRPAGAVHVVVKRR